MVSISLSPSPTWNANKLESVEHIRNGGGGAQSAGERSAPRAACGTYDEPKPVVPSRRSPRRKPESSPPLTSRRQPRSGRWRSLNPCQASGCYDPSRGKTKKDTHTRVLINDKYDGGLPQGRSARVFSPGMCQVTGRLECKPLLLCSARIL